MRYKVEHLLTNFYQVIDITDIESDFYQINVLFQGSLADCEAYIKLKQNENVDF